MADTRSLEMAYRASEEPDGTATFYVWWGKWVAYGGGFKKVGGRYAPEALN